MSACRICKLPANDELGPLVVCREGVNLGYEDDSESDSGDASPKRIEDRFLHHLGCTHKDSDGVTFVYCEICRDCVSPDHVHCKRCDRCNPLRKEDGVCVECYSDAYEVWCEDQREIHGDDD